MAFELFLKIAKPSEKIAKPRAALQPPPKRWDEQAEINLKRQGDNDNDGGPGGTRTPNQAVMSRRL